MQQLRAIGPGAGSSAASAVWALALSKRLRRAGARLDELEAQIPAPADRAGIAVALRGRFGLKRCLIAAFAGEAQAALEQAARWRSAFPQPSASDLATLACAQMVAHLQLGQWSEAERDGRAAFAVFSDERVDYGLAWSASGITQALFKQGRVDEAHALLQDAIQRVGHAPLAAAPLRLLEGLLMFERGDFPALVSRAGTAMKYELPTPMLALGRLRVAVWTMLALGRAGGALALLDTAHFDGGTEATAWWQHELAIERARTALVAGQTDARWFTGLTASSALRDLLAASRHQPTPALLAALRPVLEQAESARDACTAALLLFVRARIEREIGLHVQARRSVMRLLTSTLTRQRVGTLASLAPGLQPLFHDVLVELLRDRSYGDARLRQLAALLGVRVDAPVSATMPLRLSRRERQIAAVLLDGLSNADIAERLRVTEPTVKWHLWNLFRKLGVRSRRGAVHALTHRGLV
jgi:ATP/maltotriose-dependent transcriptional regulator MalT